MLKTCEAEVRNENFKQQESSHSLKMVVEVPFKTLGFVALDNCKQSFILTAKVLVVSKGTLRSLEGDFPLSQVSSLSLTFL